MIAAGIGGDLVVLLLGRLGAGAWSGIGPIEQILLIGGITIGLLGLPLLLLADAPAAGDGEPSYHIPADVSRDVRRPWTWAARAACVLALLIYVGYLAIYVTYAVDLFRWPYDYDQGESFELYDAVLHSRGEWPYRDSTTYPFYSSNYPPVFHILNALLFPLFGQTLLSGRILGFTITLLTAGMIGLTVYRRTGGFFLPCVSGLAYLASPFVYHVGPLCRQHLTMVFLEVVCIYFIAASADARHGTRNLLLGLLCLFLAGYAKQLAVFTAVAVFGHLFLRGPVRAILLALAFGVSFGAVFLLINWATDGYWWTNTIAANVNAVLIPQLIGLTRTWGRVHPLFIGLSAAMVFIETYRSRITVYSLWFLATLGTGMMSAKWGAGEAYWVSSVAAGIILTGFAIGKARESIASQHPRWLGAVTVFVPILFMWQAAQMIHLPTEGPIWGHVASVLGVRELSAYADYPYYDVVGYSQVGHLMLPRDYEGAERIMAHVRATTLPVLSEEAAFTMVAGKPVITNPTQLLNLYNNGLLDTSEIEAMVRDRAFGLVIMRAQFYPPPVLAAIGQHYGLVEHVPMNGFNYIIMKPLALTEAAD
jgi:hypothetical protein